MIALIVSGVVIVVAVGLLWLYSAAARNDRRSMQRYEDALGALGDLSRRSDSAAPIHPPSSEAIARPHVGLNEPLVPKPPTNNVPAPRIRLDPPTAPLVGRSGVPLFSDADLVDAESPETTDRRTRSSAAARLARRSRTKRPAVSRSVFVADEKSLDPELQLEEEEAPAPLVGVTAAVAVAPIAIDRPHRSPGGRPRGRLLVVGTVVAVVVIGAAALGVHAATSKRGPGTPPPTASSHDRSTPSTTTTTTLPTSLAPVSVTASLVTYVLPVSASYTVQFSATARCWLGVQQSMNGGYLWMDTLAAGSSTTYSGKGALIVRIGAPNALTLSVNGITVQLPAGQVHPYDVAFTTSV